MCYENDTETAITHTPTRMGTTIACSTSSSIGNSRGLMRKGGDVPYTHAHAIQGTDLIRFDDLPGILRIPSLRDHQDRAIRSVQPR